MHHHHQQHVIFAALKAKCPDHICEIMMSQLHWQLHRQMGAVLQDEEHLWLLIMLPYFVLITLTYYQIHEQYNELQYELTLIKIGTLVHL